MNTRVEEIDGKNIYIVDDVFSQDEIEAFCEYAEVLPFKRVEKSLSYDEFPIFSADFIPEKFESETSIGKKCRELLNQFYQDADQYHIWRTYINLSTYGNVEYPHHDCNLDQEDITILYYINKTWNYKYGGETIFYSQKDSRLAILPAPGRIVLFPGNIEHIGTIPTRICKLARLSLAMKFKKKISTKI